MESPANPGRFSDAEFVVDVWVVSFPEQFIYCRGIRVQGREQQAVGWGVVHVCLDGLLEYWGQQHRKDDE